MILGDVGVVGGRGGTEQQHRCDDSSREQGRNACAQSPITELPPAVEALHR